MKGHSTTGATMTFAPAHRRYRLCLSVAGALLCYIPNARGQEASTPSTQVETQSTGIGEIVVSARRRQETSQDVPVTIDALSAERLTQLGVTSSGEISRFVPNMVWQAGYGYSSPNIFLRGLGTDSFTVTTGSPVAIYVDNVVQGSTITQGFPTFDLERVEVLKGPQGTLYGRNTTGGLVNYITRKPKIESPDIHAIATIGDYGRYEVEAAGTASFGDQVALRLAGSYKRHSGYFDVAHPELIGGREHLGKVESAGGRAQLLFDGQNGFTALLKIQYGRARGEVATGQALICPPGLAEDSPFCGTVWRSYRPPSKWFTVDVNENANREDLDTFASSLSLSLDLDTITISSLSSFDWGHRKLLDDSDQTSLNLSSTIHDGKINAFSQEYRVSSNGEAPLTWTVGAYFYADEIDGSIVSAIPAFGLGGLTGGSPPVYQGFAMGMAQKTVSYALSGEAVYRLAPGLRLTAGLRWTSDTRSVRYEVSLIDASARVLDDAYMTGGDFFGTPLELFQVIPPFKDQRTWNNFSGRVIVDYELARNAMVYASTSRGYRGGEFNNGTTSPSAATFVDPETLDAYEIGLKSELFNRKVRFNASAFIYKFKDQQVYVLRQNEGEVLATTILSNAGKSTIKGVEASLEAEPVRSVYLQGGIGILDARFDKFDYSPTVSYAGNYLSSAPKLTLNGTARYSTEVNDKLGFFAQVDANYLSRHYLTVYNVDYLEAKAYALVGARAGLNFGGYTLTGWVKNLTDTHYVGHSYSTGSLGFVNRIFGEPRTMGVTLEAKF